MADEQNSNEKRITRSVLLATLEQVESNARDYLEFALPTLIEAAEEILGRSSAGYPTPADGNERRPSIGDESNDDDLAIVANFLGQRFNRLSTFEIFNYHEIQAVYRFLASVRQHPVEMGRCVGSSAAEVVGEFRQDFFRIADLYFNTSPLCTAVAKALELDKYRGLQKKDGSFPGIESTDHDGVQELKDKNGSATQRQGKMSPRALCGPSFFHAGIDPSFEINQVLDPYWPLWETDEDDLDLATRLDSSSILAFPSTVMQSERLELVTRLRSSPDVQQSAQAVRVRPMMEWLATVIDLPNLRRIAAELNLVSPLTILDLNSATCYVIAVPSCTLETDHAWS